MPMKRGGSTTRTTEAMSTRHIETRPWGGASIAAAVCSAAIVVLATGCARPSSSLGASTDQFVGLLRQTSYDYEVYTPAELAEKADAVVVAQALDVVPGRSIYGVGSHAVMSLRVLESIKGPKSVDGLVYVELPTTPVASVDAYRNALPGARMLLFLDDRSAIEADGPRGAPDDAPLYAPMPPSPVFDANDQIVIAHEDIGDRPAQWAGFKTIEEIVAALSTRQH